MVHAFARDINQRYRFDELRLDQWRAESGQLDTDQLDDLRHRERMFASWKFVKTAVRLPFTAGRTVSNLVHLAVDMDRLHSSPRRKVHMGRDCLIDRTSWLVNGENIELGDHVKVATYTALIAGFQSKIQIGNYALIGPGVIVVAANHGIAMTGVPMRDQSWTEGTVVIGEDAWLGANSVILPGSTIGNGAIVGAGTVVHGHIPPNTIVHQDMGALVMRPRR